MTVGETACQATIFYCKWPHKHMLSFSITLYLNYQFTYFFLFWLPAHQCVSTFATRYVVYAAVTMFFRNHKMVSNLLLLGKIETCNDMRKRDASYNINWLNRVYIT